MEMTSSLKAAVASYALEREEDGGYKYGRRGLARLFADEGVSEWQVRSIIQQTRGSSSFSPETVLTKKEKLQQLSSLPTIEVKVPKRSPPKRKELAVEKWIIASDFHVPEHSRSACEILYSFIEDEQPTKVIILGDLVNLDPFSRYDKAPDGPTWLEEVATAGEILGTIKSIVPEDTELEWRSGNHEDRLKKYLMRHDPLFYHNLSVPKLFMISDNEEANEALKGWKFIDKAEDFVEDLNLLLIHGEKVRKFAARSVQASIEELWMSVVMGHSHRLGIINRSSARSRYSNELPAFGVEAGCMCSYDLDYRGGVTSDWQQGFAMLTIDRTDEVPYVEPSVVKIATLQSSNGSTYKKAVGKRIYRTTGL